MKAALDMVMEGYRLLNVSELTGNISGGLYAIKRPQNSKLEDVVVNGLAINADQIQLGMFNVNTHVPNLELQFGGTPDNSMPDQVRLLEISNIVKQLLDGIVIGHDYMMWIEQPGNIMRDNDGTYYINTRVNYKSFISN